VEAVKRVRDRSAGGVGARRLLASLLAVVAVLAASLVAWGPSTSAQALSGTSFMPGLIISDSLFYDSAAMSESQIQQFLASKGSGLAGYTFSVASRARATNDSGATRCEAFQGGVLAASTIIYRAQVACGISAKVLLVTLQKEQGLITKSSPSQSALDRAMGYACPDTAPCAPTTLGFGNQVYSGALQFITYKVNHFARQPGLNSIAFSPNAACGATTIRLQNYATAALYNYTPYQPDAAALANLSGTGDGCSSYGNRNFWVYYSSWFGSTLGPAPYPIAGPSISGTTTVGDTLTVAGTWSGAPTTLSYAWMSCTSVPAFVLDDLPPGCVSIPGATDTSYLTTTQDLGKYLGYLVTATNSLGSMTTGAVMSARMGTPANSVIPAVSGLSSVGSTWTVDPGVWSGSPSLGIFWLRCVQPISASFGQVPTGCTAIPGATSSSYTTTTLDLGKYVTAQVAGSNSIGFGLAGAISRTPLGFPSNTVLPSISGAMVLGSRLTLDVGAWSGTPVPTMGIFWLRCSQPIGTGFTVVPSGCTAIPGANAASYLLTVADIGKYVTAQIAGSNSQGFGLAGALSTTKTDGAKPTNTTLPSVSGATSVGSTWSVNVGTWTGSPTFGIYWLRCSQPVGNGFTAVPSGCKAISGANASTYVVSSADAGKFITAQVAGSNALGFGLAGAVSTSAIASGGSTAAPTNTTLPSVSGAASVGSTWSVNVGTWTGSPTFGIYWLRCSQPVGNGFTAVPSGCTAISGANASTYGVTSADAGKFVTAQVAGSNTLGFGLAGAVSTSAIASGGSAAAPTVVTPPVLSGATTVGSSWSTTMGAWTGSPTFGIFWLRCNQPQASTFAQVPAGCVAISGANGASYTATSADVGKYLTAQIAATNSHGFGLSGSGISSAVQTVAAAPTKPLNLIAPSVTGAVSHGSAWTVTTGIWTGSPSIGIYWLRCDQPVTSGFTAVPPGCTAIAGANGASYLSGAADVGKFLTAQIAATGSSGYSLSGANTLAAVQ
jgi:hypothetical protein